MTIFDDLKMFMDKPVKVNCPHCSHVMEQRGSKIRKNITCICPKCGHFFLPQER
ncbi:YnfU family zinc-binding protein [Enterobacter kobei]|uniref:YnfU family zinc-binding protein n=1 Tax=Enterobacter kobei TaxID=208224 RepID=UPI001C3C368E|nr:YnfU family zinc-binding protein [Enterobacter kobei]